jgi:DNA-binding LacI/PurR family transcriptional regulator
MSNNVTLEQVEQLAAQLPQREQLKLLNRLSERLTETIFPSVTANKRERMQEAAAILHECDRAAVAFTRKTNSAETIRRMREERYQQICSLCSPTTSSYGSLRSAVYFVNCQNES